MRSRRVRRLLALAVSTVALGTASGCVGLHVDANVQPGLPVGSSGPNPALVLPPGPQVGDEPAATIRGFLRAGRIAGDGALAVAQSFLTPKQAATWNPEVATSVIAGDGSVNVIASEASGYVVSAPLVATVDTYGRWTQAKPGAVVSATVQLTNLGQVWRISALPEGFGRWVPAAALGQLLRPVELHYVAPDRLSLVPDVRWLPFDRLAARLARIQLGPIPDYLQGAVRTGLGGGVALKVKAVPVVDGVATVDLAAPGLDTDSSSRQLIWAQLVATLTQVPGVSAVAITVDGAPLDLSGVIAPVTTPSAVGVTPFTEPTDVRPLLRVGNAMISVDPSRILDPELERLPTGETRFPTILPAWTNIAESFTGQEIAAIGTDGATFARWHGDQVIQPEFFADQLTGPTYDAAGTLWVGGRGFGKRANARLWSINTTADPDSKAAVPRPVEATWLRGRHVVAIDVAIDGLRVAIASTDDRGRDPRLDIAGIERAPDSGAITLVNDPLRLGETLTGISDVVWTSSTELAVLARAAADKAPRPYLLTLGDDLTALPELAGARRITTVRGQRGLALVTANRVFLRAASRWIPLPAGTDLAVPAG